MHKANSNQHQNAAGAAEKSREQVMAEREAKKLAKLAKKQKQPTTTGESPAPIANPAAPATAVKPATTIITEVEQTTITKKLTTTTTTTTKDKLELTTTTTGATKTINPEVSATNSTESVSNNAGAEEGDNKRDQIKAEREAKKAAKQAAKAAKSSPTNNVDAAAQKLNSLDITPKPAPALPAAEADQEKVSE